MRKKRVREFLSIVRALREKGEGREERNRKRLNK
jgi:hypothetical protein